MVNRNGNNNGQQQEANPWLNLTLTGFGDPSQHARTTTPTPPPAALEPWDPEANPWATLNVSGFGPVPPQNREARTPLGSQRAFSPGLFPISPPNPYTAHPPYYINPYETGMSAPTSPSAIPVTAAVNNLRDPRNIERGALQEDGSVVITREWVGRMVGQGHIEQAPSGNLILARNSTIRLHGIAQGLHEGFLRWMTEENPHAERGAGGNAIRIKSEDAKIWFRRE